MRQRRKGFRATMLPGPCLSNYCRDTSGSRCTQRTGDHPREKHRQRISLVRLCDGILRPKRPRCNDAGYSIANAVMQPTATVARIVQRTICCPSGNGKVLALGLCATCYTLKRQDEAYFGGHREEVLKRDDFRCRVPGCMTIKRGKRSVAVHHREPRNNDPGKMLTLYLGCHAKVTRTQYVLDEWPEFLRVLWREQHPNGHEQTALDFKHRAAPATQLLLF